MTDWSWRWFLFGCKQAKISMNKLDFMDIKENAVLGDQGLQDALNGVNPQFGDLCVRVAGEVWGKPLLSQKFKTLLTIALDVSHQSFSGPGVPFEAHVTMALKQGVTFEEIEELLLMTCVYCGFNKAAGAFGRLNELKEKYGN
jgi:4-carboxymuconolactone decarboxylase